MTPDKKIMIKEDTHKAINIAKRLSNDGMDDTNAIDTACTQCSLADRNTVMVAVNSWLLNLNLE